MNEAKKTGQTKNHKTGMGKNKSILDKKKIQKFDKFVTTKNLYHKFVINFYYCIMTKIAFVTKR